MDLLGFRDAVAGESETTKNATARANERRRGKQVSVQNGAVTTTFASFGS
jgi:hypothetical protein